ncbi:hypothetical protein V1517DRAFT_339971 [Lipomyces orientalis]|uniref:Uncharacterized protein n=1 Tax=Lipomyces orientalis TaxID=1233043 RepID=A0ACC3TJD0_9ASCO
MTVDPSTVANEFDENYEKAWFNGRLWKIGDADAHGLRCHGKWSLFPSWYLLIMGIIVSIQ